TMQFVIITADENAFCAGAVCACERPVGGAQNFFLGLILPPQLAGCSVQTVEKSVTRSHENAPIHHERGGFDRSCRRKTPAFGSVGHIKTIDIAIGGTDKHLPRNDCRGGFDSP